ncbi:Proteasome subunit beta type-5 [Savitreella phatthalungensis]
MNSILSRFDRENEGLRNIAPLHTPIDALRYDLPALAAPSSFLKNETDEVSNPNCRIKLAHGTTTLAFKFKGGVMVCTDSRASAGGYIASQTVKKVIEINPFLLGTMAGGAADCQYWETYLGIQCRLHELKNKERISVAAASKILANIVYGYKGMGLSMGTMLAGWDKTGPALFYVDNDGTRAKGDLFCVGSGATFAYGVLDATYKYDLEDDEAIKLARRSILAATHRDAYSGGSINCYIVREQGWTRIGFDDMNDEFWQTKKEEQSFMNVVGEEDSA